MGKVTISASRNYTVNIKSGLLSTLGFGASQLVPGRKAFVVTDDQVRDLYLSPAMESLEQAGFVVQCFTIAHGESSKSSRMYLALLDELAEFSMTKSDILVALGGGVVGDLAGFAASTYLRGIPWIQVPTTLLAMVDSSVGGKTAINLPSGKNLTGSFYQPWYVLCDPKLLTTLPEEELCNGWAEIIKYAVLQGSPLLEMLHKQSTLLPTEDILESCITIKQHYVKDDEFDRGIRQFLNLGHTLGHAIESVSHFCISHGQAVSIGMAMVARAAAKQELCSWNLYHQLEQLLHQFGLPTTTELEAQSLLQATLRDKKRHGSQITLVIPQALGHCILYPIGVQELGQWISLGR